MEPEDETERLRLVTTLEPGEELLLVEEPRKWFLEMESAPGEDV